MIYYSRRYYVIALISFITGCNNNRIKEQAGTLQQDTIITVAPDLAKSIPTVLKDIILNEKSMIAGKKLTASKKVGTGMYRSLSIKDIDSTAGDRNGFIYHITDTLLSKPGLKILLIGREYESENIAWLCVYNDEGKLVEHKQVYYDNAEGFLLVETTIKDNEVVITTHNDYDEASPTKTEKFRLAHNNKFIQIK